MTPTTLYGLCGAALVGIGLYGLLTDPRLLRKIISFNLVGSGAFRDSWTAAQQRLTPEYGTFPNYKDPVIGESRIDWIAVTPDIQVAEAAVNTFRLDDRYPSDHAPIQATVRIQ